MGYMKIVNIYKCKEIFTFKEICAMEKIHGTSTNVSLSDGTLKFYCGGETQKTFEPLFDKDFLLEELTAILKENNWQNIKIHGEAYGAKQQAMFKTYGPKLKFIVFDIRVDCGLPTNKFLDVLDAEKLTGRLKLEFVPYVIGPCTVEFVDEQCGLDSVQAVRNGCGEGKIREGIVCRPLVESVLSNGDRAICKHINGPYRETMNKRPIGPIVEKLKIFTEAEEIANEWVTENRLNHVSSKFLHDKENKLIEKSDIGKLIDNMIADIKLEAGDEIVWSSEVIRVVRQKSGALIGAFVRKQ